MDPLDIETDDSMDEIGIEDIRMQEIQSENDQMYI